MAQFSAERSSTSSREIVLNCFPAWIRFWT